MAQIHFRNRRLLAGGITAFAALLCYCVVIWLDNQLASPAFFTGFTVMSCLIVLMLLGLRKRLPILPLGNVRTWTQIHIYTGLFATAVYVMHVPALVAGGVFECFLSLMFLTVSASGFYGLYASRSMPKRLSAIESQYAFDQMDWHRTQIANAAQTRIDESQRMAAGEVIHVFYHSFLRPFFGHRPSLAYVLIPSGNRRRRLLSDLRDLDRYLEDDSRAIAGQLAALVRRRDDLDYQFALQLRLRVWLVIHGVMSVILLGAGFVHAILAIRFTH